MKKSYIKIAAAFLGMAMLSSCLDDDKQALDPSGAKNIIEFADLSVPTSPSGAIYPVYSTAFAVSPEASFEAILSYSGPNKNDKDIVLQLAVDPIALDDFNRQMEELHEGTYELLPEANYSIETMTYTIPKGQTKVSVPITVYPDQFDLSRKFAIPLRIVSASSGTLSSNFSVAILATIAKNKYDAEYKANIQLLGWTGFSISDKAENYPDNIGLVTTGPNTNITANYLRGGEDLQPGFSLNADGSTGATGFGAAGPEFTFDDANKVILVDNTYANDGRARDFVLNAAAPAGHNVFDEATRAVTLNYFFKQSGRPDANVIMKLTYAKER
jgi:hypothetical protein